MSTRRPLVIVLHGPSGAGKDSLIARLRESTGIHRATSTTDRAPREDELDGIHYHFVDTAEFERRIAEGRFAEFARVYGEWKGLDREEIERPVANGEDVIIRTDVNGARTWRGLLEGALFVLILAADPAEPADVHREITRRRILERQPGIAPDELERRLLEVDDELADAPHNDCVVVNGDRSLDAAVAEIERIIERERHNLTRPASRLVSRTAAPG